MTTNVYTADLETNNSDIAITEKQTNVWLWDICSVHDLTHRTGQTLDEFFTVLEGISPSVVYVHNLKFDGVFLLEWLFRNGFKHTTERKLNKGEFSTLITDSKVFYSIRVCFGRDKRNRRNLTAEIRDSTKKLTGTVESIARAYKLPILKGEIDYKKHRDRYYLATPDEVDYIRNDTEIIARAMQELYEDNMTKLTTSSDTMHLYKQTVNRYYSFLFPTLKIEIDDFIRNSYRGGVVLVRKKYQEREITQPVYVYDENSMYPDKMVNNVLPYGLPVYTKGQCTPTTDYPLYIQRILVDLELKPKHMPTILQSNAMYSKLNYLDDTDGIMVELTLTNVDIELMHKHYIIHDIEYIDGYLFMGSDNLFKKYMLPVYDEKCKSEKGGKRERAKLKLNGLYGKFATNPRRAKKIPIWNGEQVMYYTTETEIDRPIYTAVSSFITAYARQDLFNAIQANYDDFIYCDTDSVHLLTDNPKGIKIDNDELGAWGLDAVYTRSKYLAQKTYYGIRKDGTPQIKIAGAPNKVKEQITFDRFKFGETFTGKLLPKTVKGGVILVDTEFTLKRRPWQKFNNVV